MALSVSAWSTRRRHVTAIALYLLVATATMEKIIVAGFSTHSVYPAADPSMPIWALAYYAHAVGHLQNPFFTHFINQPSGFSTIICTPLWSILMIPVTWLCGPVVAFNILLIVLPAASAYVMYVALRPVVRYEFLSLLAGLMWGFSPFVMLGELLGWINWTTSLSLPLLLIVASRVWGPERVSPRRAGLSLAAIAVETFYTNSEMLVVLAVAGLLALLVLGFSWWRHGATRGPDATQRWVSTLSWAIVPAGLLIAPGAWYATYGPNHLPAWVWPRSLMRLEGNAFSSLLGPTHYHNVIVTVLMTYPNSYYVGVTIAVPVAVGVLRGWRLPIVRVLSVVGVLSLWLSLGAKTSVDIFRVFLYLPIVHNVMPRSFVPVFLFCAIVIAAIGVREIIALAPRSVPVARILGGLGALLMAGQFLLSSFSAAPFLAQTVGRDRAAETLGQRYGSTVTIVSYPFPTVGRGLTAQAVGGFSYRLLGALGPTANRELPDSVFLQDTLAALSSYGVIPAHESQWLTRLRHDLVACGVNFVIVPRHLPRHLREYGFAPSRPFVSVMSQAFGNPRVIDDEWVFVVTSPRGARQS